MIAWGIDLCTVRTITLSDFSFSEYVRDCRVHEGVSMGRSSPRLFYSGFALAAVAAMMAMLAWLAGWKFYWLWFVAANIVAFVLYRYDKAQAQREGALRVSEVVLLALAVVGGIVGAAAGMYKRPRHKAQKLIFRAALLIGAAIQAWLLVVLYF